MKKFPLLFLFLVSCVSIYIDSNLNIVDIDNMNKEISLLNNEELKSSSFGYSFGLGLFYPSRAFMRFRFKDQKFFSASKDSKFYLQMGFLEGGANILKSKIFGVYPVVGIGATFQEVILSGTSYRNYVYPVINGGLEFSLNLTNDMPGVFSLYFRINGFYTSGYFLDTRNLEDFLISNPFSGISFSFGVSMGYNPEY